MTFAGGPPCSPGRFRLSRNHRAGVEACPERDLFVSHSGGLESIPPAALHKSEQPFETNAACAHGVLSNRNGIRNKFRVGMDRCVRPERFVYPVVNANSASARCHDFVTIIGIHKNWDSLPTTPYPTTPDSAYPTPGDLQFQIGNHLHPQSKCVCHLAKHSSRKAIGPQNPEGRGLYRHANR